MSTIGKDTVRKGKLLGKGYDRKIGHDQDGIPVMIITPTYLRSMPTIEFCISQRDAWLYSEEHNPLFVDAMMKLCMSIHDFYQLGIVTTQRLSIIASVVQEGLDDLIATPRVTKSKKPLIIGEVGMTMGGKRTDRPLTSNDIPNTVTEIVGAF